MSSKKVGQAAQETPRHFVWTAQVQVIRAARIRKKCVTEVRLKKKQLFWEITERLLARRKRGK